MASAKNKNYVSVWFWMLALFVMALPCVGLVMMFVWAFTGDNESRKNYFRAMIAWFLIVTIIWGGLAAFGFWPVIHQHLDAWLRAKLPR